MIAVRVRGLARVVMTLALLLSVAAPMLAAAPVTARPRAPDGRTEASYAPVRLGFPRDLGLLAKRTPGETARPKGRDDGGGAKAVDRVREIDAKKITRRLDRYLAGRPGPVTAMVQDLTTGRVYGYHRRKAMITASTAKVQILMALLLRTPWKKLPKAVRRDADIMIRYSDNHAADRLWLRIGGAAGFTAAGGKLGLRHTRGVPGTCVDLYCWGITRTTAADQVRLMKALVSDRSPLPAADRERVLRLMGAVVDGQDWGIGAARCEGDRVALKNGWLKRVSTKRWAVVSAGLVRGGGHDYAIAVFTEGSAEAAYGIATVEGVTERIMKSFRRCRR